MPEAERQTRSRLIDLFNEQGFHPRHDLGQNFLIDLNLLEYVVAEAELTPRDVVLEVGTGTGGMTAFLAEQAGAVVSVEIDPRVHSLALAKLAEFPNATLLLTDILATKNQLAPVVVDAVRERLSAIPDSRLKLIANLPYSVATPVVSNLVASDLDWTRMVITIQWELAERMRGAPGTNDYGSLAVWLQAQCDVRILKKLGPAAFWPRPKVDSAIVRIVPDAVRREELGDRAWFHDFIRRLFQQRRKVVRKVLSGMYTPDLDRDSLESALQGAGIPENARAEQLSVPQLTALARELQARGARPDETAGAAEPLPATDSAH